MIVEVLSDHPGDRLQALNQQAQREQQAIHQHHAAVAQLRTSNAASRRWWQLGLRSEHRRQERELRARAPRPSEALATSRAQLGAGAGAEDSMASALAFLSDDWTLLRGYHNGAGELDHLLIGPGGVWAIEVKMKAVEVHVDGDEWEYVKYDRYGNQVDWGDLADRRGRSWGRQVSDIAQRLADFLAKRDHPVQVRTAVVILNQRARIGEIRDLRVDYLSAGSQHFIQHMQKHPDHLERATCQAVASLAKKDHAFHAERRRRPRRS